MHKTRYRGWMVVLLSGLVLAPTGGPAAADEGPPAILNPKTYTSPSGKYAIFVDPSDLYGRGRASYKLTREGREVWSGERPYTLWQARVADDGTVAGYAYSHGPRGFAADGHQEGAGDFRVVILDPRGKERLDQITMREQSRFPHRPPNPIASGLIFDPANDRLVVRIWDEDVNRQAESWWVYQLATGKELATFRPKEHMADPEPARYVMDAKPVKGTPLTLLHWWRYDGENERTCGARFTLIGPAGEAFWSLELPADYEVAGDDEAAERLRASLIRDGGILGSDQLGRFELRFAKDAQRVAFSVSRAEDGGWAAHEIGRRPFVEAPTPVPVPAEIAPLALRPAGRVVLEGPPAGPAPGLPNVGDFVFDDRGRIVFLRWSEVGSSQSLVVANQDGDVVRTVPLAPAAAEGRPGWSGLTRAGADVYLVARDAPDDPERTEGERIDVATGRTAPIPNFVGPRNSRIAGLPDGGFVAWGGSARFTTDHSLRAFDRRGGWLWDVPGGDGRDDPATLLSPNDVAATTTGLIAVVDVIRKTVQFFDRAGRHHHTIDLEKAWGREPRYPSDLSADRDGGVVVGDFQGDPPIVRMDADGTVRAEVRPRFEDGRAFRIGCARVAPDGALWVGDGHALYRLTETGVVDRVVGRAPDPRRLDKAATVAQDARGQIYAVEGRTGAVHVFGPAGRRLRVCLPGPGDVPEELSSPHLAIADAGDVYLRLGMSGNPYLHFTPEGERAGIMASKLEDSGERWYPQPKTGRSWVLGDEKVFLVEATGAVARTIARRADGFWLVSPEDASVAADGSIAVVSRQDGRGADDEVLVSLYGPAGEPIRTFPLPSGIEWLSTRIAYDGERLVVVGDKGIVLLGRSGEVIGQFPPPPEPETWWTPFLAPGGRELWLFDGRRTFHRFECP